MIILDNDLAHMIMSERLAEGTRDRLTNQLLRLIAEADEPAAAAREPAPGRVRRVQLLTWARLVFAR